MTEVHRTEDPNLGYALACFHSIVSMQSIIKRDGGSDPHWYAPGWSHADINDMPNAGRCACGYNFWVTEHYHFFASFDGKWHTRRRCYEVITT